MLCLACEDTKTINVNGKDHRCDGCANGNAYLPRLNAWHIRRLRDVLKDKWCKVIPPSTLRDRFSVECERLKGRDDEDAMKRIRAADEEIAKYERGETLGHIADERLQDVKWLETTRRIAS